MNAKLTGSMPTFLRHCEFCVVLSTCDPAIMTGRVVYSRPFLTELGRIAEG